MGKRPLSLTIIGWLLILFTVLGLYGVITMGSNPVAMKMLEQMHVSLAFEQAWGTLGAVINLACAYGILKGLPWSRVLYVVWGRHQPRRRLLSVADQVRAGLEPHPHRRHRGLPVDQRGQ